MGGGLAAIRSMGKSLEPDNILETCHNTFVIVLKNFFF